MQLRIRRSILHMAVFVGRGGGGRAVSLCSESLLVIAVRGASAGGGEGGGDNGGGRALGEMRCSRATIEATATTAMTPKARDSRSASSDETLEESAGSAATFGRMESVVVIARAPRGLAPRGTFMIGNATHRHTAHASRMVIRRPSAGEV